jgi:hypothetical protein
VSPLTDPLTPQAFVTCGRIGVAEKWLRSPAVFHAGPLNDLYPGFRALAVAYHRIKALPHVIPAPIAIIAIRSPGLRRPARFASSSEIGSEALDVLP